MQQLGLSGLLSELKIVVLNEKGGPQGDLAEISRVAQALGHQLRDAGHQVTSIQVPPPLRHPHQGQMDNVGFLMLAFALVSVLLSSILVAAMIAGLLAGQIRQIGAMKTVGATTIQVASLYLLMTVAVSVVATGLAIAPGLLVGRALARWAAGMLNLDLADTSIGGGVLVVQIALGVLMPAILALIPVIRGSRITVRSAIDDHGTTARIGRPRAFSRWTARLTGVIVPMALRNMFRRRGRLALTVGMLSVAGAMFLTGINASNSWTKMVDDAVSVRHYDLEIRLAEPVSNARIDAALAQVAGIELVQGWGAQSVAVAVNGQIDESHVYPDDAHGSFTLLAPPPGLALLTPPVDQGRWLLPDDRDTVVLNNLAMSAQAAGAVVGQPITLTVAGGPRTFLVVGAVSDFGSQAAAYITKAEFDSIADTSGMAGQLRIVLTDHTDTARLTAAASVTTALTAAGIGVGQSIPLQELQTALDQHVLVLATALIALSVLLAIVSLMGLASSLSTSITERSREFGILKTLGAGGGDIRKVVLSEGLMTCLLSVLVAVGIALPATLIFGNFVGQQAFRSPLPYTWSGPGVLLWVLAVVLGGAAAGALAATRAVRLTISTTLITA